MTICQYPGCTRPLPPYIRGGKNVKYCPEHREIRKQESRLLAHRKQNKSVRERTANTNARGRIVVIQPGQADPDYWTWRDYELYRHALPAGTRVEFAP